MNTEHLVKMTNDIATYFAFETDHSEAVDSVVTHLRKYWEPRMRKEIVAYLAAGGGGFEPLARDAIARLGEVDGDKAA